MRYSGLPVVEEALTVHKGWGTGWSNLEPKDYYDFVLVGGGGHLISST
jgi:sarcosine oxidase subunit beta